MLNDLHTDIPNNEKTEGKFKLYTDAVLTSDVPEHRLKRGDVVKLVDHHFAPAGTEGYSIEVFNPDSAVAHLV